jgi:CP family cyanate transporter-like MFS transporter
VKCADELAHPGASGVPWASAALLWLAGNGLRLTILAVPPVLAVIRNDLHLNATEVGLLSSIPPGMFAVAALAGSLLVAHLGVRVALIGGLALVAIGSALRGISAHFPALLFATIVMSGGVAIMQPIMPAAVRQWMPARIGLGTAIYTNGLLVSEILAVLLTVPVILPLVGGSWRLSFVAWSVPIGLVALAVYAFAPHLPAPHPLKGAISREWLPEWRQGLVWRLGGVFGCVNAIYFTANAFIPIYLASKAHPDLIAGTLLALNLGQLPASLLLLIGAGRIERRAWPYFASGLLSLLSFVGMVYIPQLPKNGQASVNLAVFKPIEVKQAKAHAVLLPHREVRLIAQCPEFVVCAPYTKSIHQGAVIGFDGEHRDLPRKYGQVRFVDGPERIRIGADKPIGHRERVLIRQAAAIFEEDLGDVLVRAVVQQG